MPNPTEEVEEPTGAEATEVVEEPEATEKSTTRVETSLLDSDAFVSKVADAVFDRMKTFTGSLVEAQQAAQQIAADMVPMDQSAPPPEAAPAEPAPDVQPQRRHGMFAQPFKKKNQ
jgi:hypothetical protein